MARESKSEFDKLVDDMDTVHSKRMNALMVTAEDEDFQVMYHKLLEYAKPKLQRSEVFTESEEQVIRIEHTYKESSEDNKEGATES